MKKPNRDAVLQQIETTFHGNSLRNSHVILVTAKQRFHDETGTGALGTASTGVKARVSYAASYYDGADRLTNTVDVGTNGGSSYTRPSSVPSRSDTVLVTTTAYNSAGLAWKVTDPKGIESRKTFDALGRVTKTIENYVDGTVSDTDDKTTESTYNAVGLTTVKVVLPSSGQQVTEWVYGVTTAGGSGLNSNDLVKEVHYPDPSTGASSSSSKDVLTVNALGQALTMTDRNGTVHTYSYDVLARQTADAITTLGSGVDGTVRRLTTAYDTQGNPYLFTAYDASSGGNIVNQVKRDFNGLGQLTSEWQSHSGAVTGSSPRVQYAYSEMPSGANHSRLTSVTYASGYSVNYNYASGLDANISRLSSLSDSSNTLEAYSYLGLGTVVKRAHSQPGVDLSYIKLSTESVGDAGDQYTGLDRFSRIVDQRWINGSNTDVDRYQYGYDRDGNRLYKDNKVITSLSEVYTYDLLNQLASYKLGTLNGTKTDVTGSPSNSQSWDYDAVGNWDSITTNSTTQTRTANKQNEITAVTGATTPTYDSNGNLTTDENNYRFVYDAWNKVVQVKNSSNVVLVTYGRDALHRHVTDTVGSTVTDRFFSTDWQLLETKVGSNTVTRNVWSPAYVDGLVLRDRDTDANGTLDERLYSLQDANWNTTALVNTSGTVQERYTYTPFGQVTFRDSSGSTLSNSAKDWIFLHQGGEKIAAGDYEFRNRLYSPSLGRWLSNDPLRIGSNLYEYCDNAPLTGVDPSGLVRIVGVIPPPPKGVYILRIEPTDRANPPYKVGDCYIQNDNGTFTPIRCPNMPRNDPEGPSYLQGMQGLMNGYQMLIAACEKCANDLVGCTKERCKKDAAELIHRLVNAWQNNYGKGCHSSVGDPVGGYFCWDWSQIFLQAVKGMKSPCYHSTEWAASPNDPKNNAVHYYLWVGVGGGNGQECSVMFDDGYFLRQQTATPGSDWPRDKWHITDPKNVPPSRPRCPGRHPLPN